MGFREQAVVKLPAEPMLIALGSRHLAEAAGQKASPGAGYEPYSDCCNDTMPCLLHLGNDIVLYQSITECWFLWYSQATP